MHTLLNRRKSPGLYRPAAAAFLLAISVPDGRTELAWEHVTVAMEVQPGQKEARAVFRFTNRGNAPVRIIDVHASCGCTVAKPEKTLFAPGESSELPARMTLTGANKSVSLQVTTDEPAGSRYELAFRVTLLEPVQMTPRLLVWHVGEVPDAKRVTLILRPGVRILAAEVQGAEFSARVETSGGNETVLWVKPVGTAMRAQATLKLSATQDSVPLPELKGFLRVL